MNDLVSRSAIWELIGEDDAITVKPGSKLAGVISRYAKAIDGAPVVDAKPIVHGRWVQYPECLQYEGALHNADIVCSVCHEVFNILDNDVDRFYYCPKCGAKMDDDVAAVVKP